MERYAELTGKAGLLAAFVASLLWLAFGGIASAAVNAQNGSDAESNLPFLFALYTITWLAFFAYAFYMTRRQSELKPRDSGAAPYTGAARTARRLAALGCGWLFYWRCFSWWWQRAPSPHRYPLPPQPLALWRPLRRPKRPSPRQHLGCLSLRIRLCRQHLPLTARRH